jgi:hypothetical protein
LTRAEGPSVRQESSHASVFVHSGSRAEARRRNGTGSRSPRGNGDGSVASRPTTTCRWSAGGRSGSPLPAPDCLLSLTGEPRPRWASMTLTLDKTLGADPIIHRLGPIGNGPYGARSNRALLGVDPSEADLAGPRSRSVHTVDEVQLALLGRRSTSPRWCRTSSRMATAQCRKTPSPRFASPKLWAAPRPRRDDPAFAPGAAIVSRLRYYFGTTTGRNEPDWVDCRRRERQVTEPPALLGRHRKTYLRHLRGHRADPAAGDRPSHLGDANPLAPGGRLHRRRRGC